MRLFRILTQSTTPTENTDLMSARSTETRLSALQPKEIKDAIEKSLSAAYEQVEWLIFKNQTTFFSIHHSAVVDYDIAYKKKLTSLNLTPEEENDLSSLVNNIHQLFAEQEKIQPDFRVSELNNIMTLIRKIKNQVALLKNKRRQQLTMPKSIDWFC